MNYREKAIRLGKETPLMAIVTEPPAGIAASGKGVVLLNAGLLHRVGPSRLNVQIARRLAPLGHVSLRFDFSGIGDSEARRDGLPFERSSVLEVQDAMAALAARGVRDYTLAGLCSGADAAFLTALADTRVTGLIMMDPWIYHTAPHSSWRFRPMSRQWSVTVPPRWPRSRSSTRSGKRDLCPTTTSRAPSTGWAMLHARSNTSSAPSTRTRGSYRSSS